MAACNPSLVDEWVFPHCALFPVEETQSTIWPNKSVGVVFCIAARTTGRLGFTHVTDRLVVTNIGDNSVLTGNSIISGGAVFFLPRGILRIGSNIAEVYTTNLEKPLAHDTNLRYQGTYQGI